MPFSQSNLQGSFKSVDGGETTPMLIHTYAHTRGEENRNSLFWVYYCLNNVGTVVLVILGEGRTENHTSHTYRDSVSLPGKLAYQLSRAITMGECNSW